MARQLGRLLINGFALPVALFGMLAVGALVTGGFYATSTSTPRAPTEDLRDQALTAAMVGLREALADDEIASHAIGPPVVLYRNASGSAFATYEITVRTVGDSITVVASEGRVRAEGGEAVRRVEKVIRTRDDAPRD